MIIKRKGKRRLVVGRFSEVWENLERNRFPPGHDYGEGGWFDKENDYQITSEKFRKLSARRQTDANYGAFPAWHHQLTERWGDDR